MAIGSVLARLPRYLWAAPCSIAGLAIGTYAILSGAEAGIRDGTLQICGGRLAHHISRLPTRLRILAFTHGHVIYAIDREAMDANREHELVHVRQYERWGPLFPVLYVGSSLAQKWKGLDPYFMNWFEREARKGGDPR